MTVAAKPAHQGQPFPVMPRWERHLRCVMRSLPKSFSALVGPQYVEYANADVVGTTLPPPAELIHRIHLVASPGPGLVTVCASAEGWRFLPGGRLEPGESLAAAITRELREEAGSRPTGTADVFFSHIATSRAAQPYLPHAPHPVSWWSYAVVTTEVIGAPTCPDGGEQITELHHLKVREAAGWLQAHDPVHADVVRLAATFGLL